MKIIKKVLLILIIILIIVILLFGINLVRNYTIIDNIAKTYENDFNNLDNFYEYSKIIFDYDNDGNSKSEAITEGYYKDGILKAYNNAKMIGDDYLKTIYYYNSKTKETIYCDEEGNLLNMVSTLKDENGNDIEIKKMNIEEKGPSFIMRIDSNGAKGLKKYNTFNIIKIENNCFVINQNDKGEKLLINKDTYLIEKRLDVNNNVIWECKLEKNIVKDEDITKPKVKEEVSIDVIN